MLSSPPSVAHLPHHPARRSYGAPVIERIDVVGTYKPRADTTGGDLIRVIGQNFGDRGVAQPALWYGRGTAPHVGWLQATACQVLSHTEVTCRSVPGVGVGLRAQLRDVGERGCSIDECRSSDVADSGSVDISCVAAGLPGGPMGVPWRPRAPLHLPFRADTCSPACSECRRRISTTPPRGAVAL